MILWTVYLDRRRYESGDINDINEIGCEGSAVRVEKREISCDEAILNFSNV
jgi:hypothetical protein